ncbi:MAG: MoaD/ThiS family protein [Candidatus Odinarchaeia archaeon]
MAIKVRFFALLRELVGVNSIDVEIYEDNIRLLDIFKKIKSIDTEKEKYFVDKILSAQIKVILNGESITNREINKIILKNGDELALLPPVGGG